MSEAISSSDLFSMINSEDVPVVIEALPAHYYNTEHIPGAINIPLDEIADQAALLVPDKRMRVVVYCANALCKNSQQAAAVLRQMGYVSVYEYTDGKQGWREAGFPLEQ